MAADLEAAGLVRRALAFELLARLGGHDAALRAGEYALAPSLRPAEILDRFVRGAVRTHELSIPEGLRAEEIAAEIDVLLSEDERTKERLRAAKGADEPAAPFDKVPF